MQTRSRLRRAVLIAGLLLLAPLAAHAVTTNVTVTGADGQPVAGQEIQIVDAGGEVVAEGRTDDDGRVGFDLAAGGTYVAQTPDGKQVSRPFEAGQPVGLRVPTRAAAPEPDDDEEIGIWRAYVDIGGGYRSASTDTEATVQRTFSFTEEIRLGPFPDSPVEIVARSFTRSFHFGGDESIDGGFGTVALQVEGPPCVDMGHVAPLLFASFPTNQIDGTLLSGDAAGTPVNFGLRSWRWDIGLGLSRQLGHGFGAELALVYGNDRVRLSGQVGDASDSDTFHVHYLGPGLTLTKELWRNDTFTISLFTRGSALFPVGHEDETLEVDGARFEYEAEEQYRIQGGVRIGYDLGLDF
jgi:hypothetical protein